MNQEQMIAAQLAPYTPWLIIAGVFVLFLLLRVMRKVLRRHIEEIGHRMFGANGWMVWFWLNAPGVMLHELSHALVILLFSPFGFRITSISFFRIKPIAQYDGRNRLIKGSGASSIQLGEVQYKRPSGRLMSHIGDGVSAVAPLFGGLAMLAFLYWVATGYNIWEIHLNIFRPGWPWWTLLFAPYLIFTVTSELWPSRVDWHGANKLLIGLLILSLLALLSLWYLKVLVFDNATVQVTASIAMHIDYVLLILLALDILFFIIAEFVIRLVRR